MNFDVLIKNGNVFGHGEGIDIGVQGERIAAIGIGLADSEATLVIEARGKLVTPGFVDPHVHLDKALISEVVRTNESGTLSEAIAIIWEKKRAYLIEDIQERAGRVVRWSIANGTTAIRTHADVDSIGGLTPVKALLGVKEAFKRDITMQIVAFPQEGIIQDPGAAELMKQALQLGADVVGGMPYNELTYDDSKRHIDLVFSLAQQYDVDIDMHVDETDDPSARTLQYLAAQTIRNGYEGRVTAGHTCALAAYDDPYAAKVIGMVKRAGMNMITNPVTNLMLQGRYDHQPVRRGITRVKELISAGVNTTFGQDCLKDTFYPTFGRADMLEVGLVTAHAAQFSMPNEIEYLMRMLTENAARTMRLKDYGLASGAYADLVILDCPTPQEAFRLQPDRMVLRRGRVIAERMTTQKLFL